MLVLFETAAGFAVFKLLDEKKLQKSENLFSDFETPQKAQKLLKLKQFAKFKDTTEALAGATAAIEGKMSKSLKSMLKKVFAQEAHEQLAVADAKLGNAIKEKLNIQCVSNSAIHELMRCIRAHSSKLIDDISSKEMAAMSLGLAHSLSRYKLKFSPDKVDTMIIQAVSLLDDLDKELNNYIMRCREWYGWHFPELSKIISDNVLYVKTVKAMGTRENASSCDFSEILTEDLEEQLKENAEISMGTEISDEDIENIHYLCDQVLELSSYRTQLYEYLQNRMYAIAPNLTMLVGDLVGARLISHAGSLLNLAKHPASTVQILGAEKALFRALKAKHDTPKYGLIYHAQLIGQSSAKLKGKMARMLAAKSSLAIRVDAFGEGNSQDLGIEHKANLEMKLKQLEEGGSRRISGTAKRSSGKFDVYQHKSQIQEYKVAEDNTIPTKPAVAAGNGTPVKKKVKKETQDQTSPTKKAKKIGKKAKKGQASEIGESSGVQDTVEAVEEKPKKKKRKHSEVEPEPEPAAEEAEVEKPKKKKKKQKQ